MNDLLNSYILLIYESQCTKLQFLLPFQPLFVLLTELQVVFLHTISKIVQHDPTKFHPTIRRELQKNWELPALSDYRENTSYSYGELAREIARLHLLFRELGIEKGEG